MRKEEEDECVKVKKERKKERKRETEVVEKI
jgi:hypothetical protein